MPRKELFATVLGAACALYVIAQQTPAGSAALHEQQAQERRDVTPEGRQKIESALPLKAFAKPRKRRRLLIVDYRGGHPSVPYADLAVQWMGAKTGAYEAVISHDMSLIGPDKLREFDAVYLNNTVGNVFSTPEFAISLPISSAMAVVCGESRNERSFP